MKRLLIILAALSLGAGGVVPLAAQSARDSLFSRASQIGYSDGFVKGVRDRQAGAPTDYRKAFDYQGADRGYAPDLGALERYQTGYRRGYEIGYEDGFNGQAFAVTGVAGLDRDRGDDTRKVTYEESAPSASPQRDPAPPEPPGQAEPHDRPAGAADGVQVPENLRMRVELLSSLSTKENKVDDKFTARVLSPEQFRGALVEGRIAKIKSAGRAKGTSEMSLAFTSITLDNGNGPTGPLQAQIEEVYDVENAGQVDDEGRVQGKRTRKRDAVKIGGGAAAGALIGGLIGGGKGAAVGAAIGAAAGATSVLATKGEQMVFPTGTELVIRTGGRSQR